MFSEGEETWVLMAMTWPEAEQFTMVATAGQYLSTHVPEAGPVGEGGTVNALMRSRRGPVQFFGCQESGHVITNCPHCAQGTSAPGSTLTYNWPSAPHQRTDTSVPDMACAMDVTRRL